MADKDISLRQQAEDLFAQLRSEDGGTATTGTPLRGQHRQRSGGPGHEFWQYRDFQSGDHSRSIDWKQSGKTDRILIRQKEKETRQRISLWLQNDLSMKFSGVPRHPSKYECGAIFALVIAMLAASRHDPVSLSGAGAVSLNDLTHIVAQIEVEPSPDDMKGDEVFLIGDFLLPLGTLRQDVFDAIPGQRPGHLIQILDPAELDLPFTGRVHFETPDAAETEAVLNVGTIRTSYQARLQSHLDEVRHYAEARGWSYHLVRTGDDYSHTLRDLLVPGEKR